MPVRTLQQCSIFITTRELINLRFTTFPRELNQSFRKRADFVSLSLIGHPIDKHLFAYNMANSADPYKC